MPVIRAPDGKIYDYAEYEDKIKPLWKHVMSQETQLENAVTPCCNCRYIPNCTDNKAVDFYYCANCGLMYKFK